MKRILNIIFWVIFFGVLLIFAIALAMNGFSVEKLTQAIKGNQIEQQIQTGSTDFDDVVDEFLANELGGGQTGDQITEQIETGSTKSNTGTILDLTGSLSDDVTVEDFADDDYVAKDIGSEQELLNQIRLEHFQEWKRKEFGEEQEETIGTGEVVEDLKVHEAPTKLTEEDKDMLDVLNENVESDQENEKKEEDKDSGVNDLPDIEFSEGPIGRIEE